jgi:hypothetical protein
VYTLNRKEFSNFDLKSVGKFVEFWRQFYKYDIKIPETTVSIDYASELNMGADLTEQNLVRLLRWKDPRLLTEKIFSGPNQGATNVRVDKVKAELGSINDFRNGKLTYENFQKIVSNLFPEGDKIWPIFLVHIARPLEYPIADQHVYRAFRKHMNVQLSDPWVFYEEYRKYFENLFAEYSRTAPKQSELLLRKNLDDALFAFGKFLDTYDKQAKGRI